jgi:hypothetical protein
MPWKGRNNLSRRQKWLLAATFAVPVALVLAKWLPTPASEFLMRYGSLVELPRDMHGQAQYVLLVPFGAVLVVFTRLTLGIRVLGPFRSILIAIAFNITGVRLGLAFLCVVLLVVIVVRPLLKSIRLPYFGRVSVILATVASVMICALLCSRWLDVAALQGVAYFPIVVLCLMGEGVARTLTKEGPRSALWRLGATLVLAIIIAQVSSTALFTEFMLRFPELLIMQIGCIVFISEYINWRLLQGLNPKPVVKKAKEKRKKAETTKKKKATKKRASASKSKSKKSRRSDTKVHTAKAAEPDSDPPTEKYHPMEHVR